MANLVSNAVKYSPEGTRVLLKVSTRAGHASLVVQDHGAGISEDELRIIFEPFGRGRRAHAAAKGAGLGLAIVREIVVAHGGIIDVQSKVNEGTTVTVLLPLIVDEPKQA